MDEGSYIVNRCCGGIQGGVMEGRIIKRGLVGRKYFLLGNMHPSYLNERSVASSISFSRVTPTGTLNYGMYL